MLVDLETKSMRKGWENVGMFSFKKTRPRGDMVIVLKYWIFSHDENEKDLFSVALD